MPPGPRRTVGDEVSPLWAEWIPHRIGNRLFVDFVNTAYRESAGYDPLVGWPDLLHFLALTNALPEAERARLTQEGTGRAHAPGTAEVLRDARRLRSALEAMVNSIVTGKRVRPEWIETINGALAAGDGNLRLRSDGARWHLELLPAAAGPRLALLPIARSAAEFLAKDDFRRLHRCASPDCVLYFYDTSRTGRRRWCCMELCGNRAKVHAHLQRRAAGRASRLRANAKPPPP